MNEERLIAVRLLQSLIEKKTSLNELLTATNLANANRPALVKQLCYGCCRHYFELEAIALQLLKKKPKETSVWLTILSGLYQLKYMHMPDYAVVKESVAIVKKLKKIWAKGLVNAVLRNYCRNKQTLDREAQSTHPQWLVQMLQQTWPQHYQQVLAANDRHPPMTLRVNRQKITVEDYLALLSENGIGANSHEFASDAIVLSQAIDVKLLPKFSHGYVSVQDASPQLLPELLTLNESMRVLDACCAPGGKTCHMLERNVKYMDAIDISAKRLEKVYDNLKRLELTANVVCADVTDTASWWDKKTYDCIVLDAPCSATGVIRRHPDIKLLRSIAEVEQICDTQAALLEALWPLLKQGGKLMYATCSVLAQENDEQIKRFIKKHPDASIHALSMDCGIATAYGLQILPGAWNMDGFYYALLEKG